tara:strand:- start:71 stop:364 length:294 start_codon:yes stop_codon:yes gene_type:complete
VAREVIQEQRELVEQVYVYQVYFQEHLLVLLAVEAVVLQDQVQHLIQEPEQVDSVVVELDQQQVEMMETLILVVVAEVVVLQVLLMTPVEVVQELLS